MEKIIIAGDFVPQDRVATLIETGKYAEVFSDIEPVTSTADYSIVNLEAPVVLGEGQPIVKNGPNLRTSIKAVEALKWAGFNCVTLANNHFYDFGEKGAEDTIEACRKLRIDIVGAGHNLAEASRTLYKEIQGKTFAFINCCEHEYSIATESTAGSNPINPIRQYYVIRESKEKADHVIVVCHGGIEHFQYPTPRMVEWYRFFIDAGADAVINHHQHCYSGFETYNGKPIFYGLGNFCFDRAGKRSSNWNKGYMVELTFDESRITFNLIPYIQCDERAEVRVHYSSEFAFHINSLNESIKDKNRLDRVFEDYSSSRNAGYDMLFLPYNNRFSRKLYSLKLLPDFFTKHKLSRMRDILTCESHYDRFKQYIMQLYNNLIF